MKISARNQFKGTITTIEKGAVNALVTIQVSDGTEIVSSITNASVDNLGLTEGGEAYAVIKASDVMVGVDS